LSGTARRAQLLDAAREVFATQGYQRAAMDDIAGRAQMSKSVLYQHFPSKLGLYQALLASSAQELLGCLRGAIDATNDTEQRVLGAVSAYFEFVAGRGEAFGLVFASGLRSEPQTAAVLAGALNECIDAVAEAITADAGMNRDRARLLAVGLIGLGQVGAQYWLDFGQAVPKDEAVALMASLAWRGLARFPLATDQPGALPW
jgi:AcrR family transcriptional regulator